MQHCHIAQWYDGLKHSGMAGIHLGQPPYRATPRGEQHSSTLCFPVDADHRWTAYELAVEVRVCHRTVLHILHDILGFCRLAAHWIPHEISAVQQWHSYAVAQALLDRYQREGEDFLELIVAVDGTWACSYKPNLKCQSHEWKHPGSPRPKKMHPIQCTVKVMFIVAYYIDVVIPHMLYPQGIW